MSRDETSTLLVVLVAVISLVGVAVAALSMSTGQSFNGMMSGGRGMMNNTGQTTTGPGPIEWSVLVLSTAFLVLAVALFARGRARSTTPPPPAGAPPATGVPPTPSPSPAPVAATVAPTATAATPPAAPALAAEAVPEPALMKLLDQDERTMYLEIRDHGGSMLQRDLVALGIFSKAKVTRVLDRLEAKDLVVREAHGMTNRVRILGRAK